MTSSEYQLLRQAILERRQAHFIYKGHLRETCPHALGLGKNGEEKVLVYQFGGSSGSAGSMERVIDRDRWRCLDLVEISDLVIKDGPWSTSENHSQPSSCVKAIDVEVDH